MKKNKVLQVCSYYMGTNLYQNLFDELEKKGIEEDVLYYCAESTVLRDVPKNFIVSQVYKPMERFVFSIKHTKVYNDVSTKIDSESYFMTHAHSLVSNGYISYRLKKEFNIPYIVAVRNADLFVFFKVMPHLIFLARKILNEAENVIFISPAYKELTINKYVKECDREAIRKKSIVIPNGIDKYYLDNPVLDKQEPKDTIRLVYVGRVDDLNKNVRTIIKAADILIKNGQKVTLKLIGRYKKKLYNYVIPKRDYIEFVPETDKKGVKEHLDKSDIFVMPSKRETFGLVYVEAMSQGLPVIYSKGQGFDGHFEEGKVGYHVKYNNAKEIANRIMDIKHNYKEMSKNAQESSKQFNWKDISGKYVDIYNKIKNKQ